MAHRQREAALFSRCEGQRLCRRPDQHPECAIVFLPAELRVATRTPATQCPPSGRSCGSTLHFLNPSFSVLLTAWDTVILEERLATLRKQGAGSSLKMDAKCACDQEQSPPLLSPLFNAETFGRGLTLSQSVMTLVHVSPRPPGNHRRSSKALEDAENLLQWLLQGDPHKRPSSLDSVLQHEFFGGSGQPRQPGSPQGPAQGCSARPLSPFQPGAAHGIGQEAHGEDPWGGGSGAGSGKPSAGGMVYAGGTAASRSGDESGPVSDGGRGGSLLGSLGSLGAGVAAWVPGYLKENATRAGEVLRGYVEGAGVGTGTGGPSSSAAGNCGEEARGSEGAANLPTLCV